jgi:hypothetical protein
MEEFKAIENYDYLISNHGNVKSNITGIILKPGFNKATGYYYVSLSKNGKSKTFTVHRLVANAFIPNPENKQQVDHIDNCRINNNINNLRWCTSEQNQSNKGLSKANKTKVKGVYFDKNRNVWRAEIQHNGKKSHLGVFRNLEDAFNARQEAAKELFGEFINKVELEININNIKPNSIIKLNININNEQKELEELEREFEELIK